MRSKLEARGGISRIFPGTDAAAAAAAAASAAAAAVAAARDDQDDGLVWALNGFCYM